MASSKAHRFAPLLYEQSLWAKAHSHPARIMILIHLQANGTSSYKELCSIIPLARETVSQHLISLRKLGFVKMEENFPHSFYTLNHDRCKDLNKKIKSLIHLHAS